MCNILSIIFVEFKIWWVFRQLLIYRNVKIKAKQWLNKNLPSSDGLISLQRNNLLVRVIDLVIVIQSPKSVHSTQGPYPIYQLCVFPPNLPVVCVFPPNLPVVCVSTQFTSCVFPPNLPVVCVFPPNSPVVCVFPPYLPVVSASILYTGCVCVFFHLIYRQSAFRVNIKDAISFVVKLIEYINRISCHSP
jgi:hypothetical protein